jgi:hypothetical protein
MSKTRRGTGVTIHPEVGQDNAAVKALAKETTSDSKRIGKAIEKEFHFLSTDQDARVREARDPGGSCV